MVAPSYGGPEPNVLYAITRPFVCHTGGSLKNGCS